MKLIAVKPVLSILLEYTAATVRSELARAQRHLGF